MTTDNKSQNEFTFQSFDPDQERKFKASPRAQKSAGERAQGRKTVMVKPSREEGDSFQKSTGAKGTGLLYDARGVRVKKSRVSNSFLKTLLFFVLPYIVINTIIFLLVTASPEVNVSVGGTDDYRSCKAKFSVSCLLPIREMSVTVNSEPVEYEKSGSSYISEVRKNGTFYVEATALNGMRSVGYTDVSVLDDMPPAIDEHSCHIEGGVLTFSISDTLSGVDWASIYAMSLSGHKAVPSSVDKDNGIVAIEMPEDQIELFFTDMVGNSRSASITATTEQMSAEGPVTGENEGEGEAEGEGEDGSEGGEEAAGAEAAV